MASTAARTIWSCAARACSTRSEGVDAVLDVRVDERRDRRARHRLDANGHRVVDGAGLVLAPAFVDPHVHLRVPGGEDEETIASGTAAAAAGGYCAILAMPNTDPVVDSAAVLGSLDRGRAGARRRSRSGSSPRSRSGQDGAELTEMAELADAGAAGFTDDGRPVVAPGLMRRALQYHAITGRRLALHCEEPTLSQGGQMHEGAVSAELGFTGYPSVAESLMVERDLSLAAYEDAAAPSAAPVGAGVGRGAPGGAGARRRRRAPRSRRTTSA